MQCSLSDTAEDKEIKTLEVVFFFFFSSFLFQRKKGIGSGRSSRFGSETEVRSRAGSVEAE